MVVMIPRVDWWMGARRASAAVPQLHGAIDRAGEDDGELSLKAADRTRVACQRPNLTGPVQIPPEGPNIMSNRKGGSP